MANSTEQRTEASDPAIPDPAIPDPAMPDPAIPDPAMPDPITDALAVSESDMQLPQDKKEKIECLPAGLEYGSFEDFFTDRPCLNDETEEIELEKQAEFPTLN